MKRLEGKVALVTGAARGQGRAHAVGLAQEGADIIALDICRDVETVPYPGATDGDLAHTAELVAETGRRVLPFIADVRDLSALEAAVRDGVETLGGIDIAVANAGIATFGSALELDDDVWQTMLDVNLTGVWKTVKAVAPVLIEGARGGSIILISSVAGLTSSPNMAHYAAAKHGVTGLMRTLAVELAPHQIRVNSVHPGNVDTPMVSNPHTWKTLIGIAGAAREQAAEIMTGMNALRVPWLEVSDVTAAIIYLASQESRYVTGTTMVLDAGFTMPFKIPHA